MFLSMRKHLAAACLAILALSGSAQAANTTLTVASWGGKIDETLKKAMDGFEQQFGVKIRWVPGNSTENAAKVVATKANPEFDVVMLDDVGLVAVSDMKDVITKLDLNILTNYADLRPQAKFPSMDGVPVGFNFLGIFYNEEEFKKRGWSPPTTWNDLYRAEFCNSIGFMHPNLSYTINLLVLFAGGDVNKVPDTIEQLAKLKGCITTLEPSASKLEEKLQLGEYLVGVNGGIRVLPLALAGYPVRFVIPSEGSTLSSTTASVVRGGKEKLAQEFLNWLVSPRSQQVLMEEAFYVPANSKVDIPQKLAEMGMPGAEALTHAVDLDRHAIIEHRREWARKLERALAP